MSSASTAVALYASTISPSQILGAVPEDSKELAHHVKGGKGFINPWESFSQDKPGWQIGKAMIMYMIVEIGNLQPTY
jgi:N-acyl-phosphatidylethanolamine-hydrolysing phospholipase D